MKREFKAADDEKPQSNKYVFKIGDRVRVYWSEFYADGTGLEALSEKVTIIKVQDQMILVRVEQGVTAGYMPDRQIWFHSKSCRRLKKKERRRVWVPFSNTHGQINSGKSFDTLQEAEKFAHDCIADWEVREFVEVRRK